MSVKKEAPIDRIQMKKIARGLEMAPRRIATLSVAVFSRTRILPRTGAA
jgi:hypothetical protein